jgi:hypothetical protein
LYQARAVRDPLAAPSNRVKVAEADRRTSGFVVATTGDPDRRIGEIVMFAVDPSEPGAHSSSRSAAWQNLQRLAPSSAGDNTEHDNDEVVSGLVASTWTGVPNGRSGCPDQTDDR